MKVSPAPPAPWHLWVLVGECVAYLAAISPPGEVDVKDRSDFSRFEPRPGRPHFSNFGPPPRGAKTFLPEVREFIFCGAKTFLRRRPTPVGAGWGPRRTFTVVHRGPSDRL